MKKGFKSYGSLCEAALHWWKLPAALTQEEIAKFLNRENIYEVKPRIRSGGFKTGHFYAKPPVVKVGKKTTTIRWDVGFVV